MGALYLGKAPKCPVHGPMKSRGPVGSRWVCVGFDGIDGCEETGRIEWIRLEDHYIEKGSLELGDVIMFGMEP